jgi:hypothetical protein
VAAAPFAVALLFFVRFGAHSWHPTDYEMLVGFCWRVWNGEMPYRDFLYVRTPLSLYLHSAWFALPDAIEVRASRLGYFLQFASAAALPAFWAVRAGLVAPGWRLPLCCALFAAVGFHNFPIMPWYTVDGIWFSSLGITAALASTTARSGRRVLGLRVVAAACFTAAALCKQNFVALPAAFGAVACAELVWRWRRRDAAERRRSREALALFVASVLPMAALAGGFLVWVAAAGAMPGFVNQVLGSAAETRPLSETGRLLAGGAPPLRYVVYQMYLEATLAPMLLLGVVAALAVATEAAPLGRRLHLGRVATALFFVAVGSSVASDADARYAEVGHMMVVMLVGMLAGRVVLLVRRPPPAEERAREALRLLLHAGVLLTAWSAGVSWGYMTPILGVAVFGVVVHDVLPPPRAGSGGARALDHLIDLGPAVLATVVVVLAFDAANRNRPYRDRPVAEQTEDLGRLFPKLTGIHTNPDTFARYLEAHTLIKHHAVADRRPFFVLHEYPGLNYLFDTRNPVSIDWFWEPDYLGNEPRLLAEIRTRRPLVLLMRDRITPLEPGPITGPQPPPCHKQALFYSRNVATPFVLEVMRQARLLGGGTYFCLVELPP